MLDRVLNATVKMGMGDIPDVDITPFVISITRDLSICDIANHVTIDLSPEFQVFVDRLGFWLKPYDSLLIMEEGELAFNGTISSVKIAKKPAKSFIIEGDDNYKRARDYFNDDPNETSLGENVNFWVNTFATRIGLTYTCDDSFLGTRGVAPGTEFGLRSVDDCLQTLAAYAGGYFYMTTSGHLHLHKGQFINKKRIIIISGGNNNLFSYDSQTIFNTVTLPSGTGLTAKYFPLFDNGGYSIFPETDVDNINGVYYNRQEEGHNTFVRVDPTINLTFTDGEIPDSLPTAYWDVEWDGTISPDYTGLYTFYLDHNAGAKLYVDNQLLLDTLIINNWTSTSGSESFYPVYMQAGVRYPIKLNYYPAQTVFGGDGASRINLQWSSPDVPKQTIPGTNLFDEEYGLNGDGLVGKYYNSNNFTNLNFTRTDPLISFNIPSGTSPGGTITGNTPWSVQWDGYIKPNSANYYFLYDNIIPFGDTQSLSVQIDGANVELSHVNGGTFMINGSFLFGSDPSQKHRIRLRYSTGANCANTLQFSWSDRDRYSTYHTQIVVPQSNLFTSNYALNTIYRTTTTTSLSDEERYRLPVFNGEWYKDDSAARNHIMVWGWKDPNKILASGESSWISSERWNDLSLPVNKTVLYSSPMIQTQQEADRLANDIAKAFNHYGSIKTFEINGSPKIKLGYKSIYYVHLQDIDVGTTITGNGPITSFNSKLDEKGYIATVKIDETCPKFAGWSVEPTELRNIWIAARQVGVDQGGNGIDPIQQKLVYTSDFGLGGQPTYHIVKGIPEGVIIGMTPLRDESVLFLAMHDPSTGISSLWSSINPTEQNGTWKLEFKSDDIIDKSKFIGYVDPTGLTDLTQDIKIDKSFFNITCFGSMAAYNKTLYVGIRWIQIRLIPTAPGFPPRQITYRRHMTAVYKDGNWTYYAMPHSFEGAGIDVKLDAPYSFPGGLLAGGGWGCSGGISAVVGNYGHYYHGALGWAPGHARGNQVSNDLYCAREVNSFDNPVMNGIDRGNGVGGIWTNDLGSEAVNSKFYRCSTDFNSYNGSTVTNYAHGAIVSNEAKILENFIDRNLGRTVIRGDYFGTQVQFVTPALVPRADFGDSQGDLFVSLDGNTFLRTARWKLGIVICIDPKDPKRLAWFTTGYGTRYASSAGNEQARISEDSGYTWSAMTGNWWGSNGDVLNDVAIQSGGQISIINVEPTFVLNE